MSLRRLNGKIRESENIKRIVECHQNNRLSSFELYFLRGADWGLALAVGCHACLWIVVNYPCFCYSFKASESPSASINPITYSGNGTFKLIAASAAGEYSPLFIDWKQHYRQGSSASEVSLCDRLNGEYQNFSKAYMLFG